jgi:hypothetical protein
LGQRGEKYQNPEFWRKTKLTETSAPRFSYKVSDGKTKDAGGNMTLRLSCESRIHNFRNYPPETVAELRTILAFGALADPDPHRKGFYDVESGPRKFYIHAAPDGSIWLLASWLKHVTVPPQNQDLCAAACS